MRQKLAQLILFLVVHIEETYHATARRLHLLLDFLIDGASIVVAAHNQRVEPDLFATDARNHRSRDDDPWNVGDQELKGKQRDKRLVIRFIGSHFIVENDDKKQNDDTQKRDKKRLSQLFQPRLLVHLLVGTRNGMEDQPTDGDDDDANPKTGRNERMGDAVPIVDVKVFVRLAEEIEQRPRQNGSNPIDDEIKRCQSFLIHNER